MSNEVIYNIDVKMLKSISCDKNFSYPKYFRKVTSSHDQAVLLQQYCFSVQNSTCDISDTTYDTLSELSKKTMIPLGTIKRFNNKFIKEGFIKTFQRQMPKKIDSKTKMMPVLHITVYFSAIYKVLNEIISQEINGNPLENSHQPKMSFREFPSAQNELSQGKPKMSFPYNNTNTSTNTSFLPIEKNDYKNDSLSLYDAKPKPAAKKKEKQLTIIEENNPHNLPEDLFSDWIEVRKVKRAPLTKTAMKGMNRELSKCVELGFNAIECFKTVVENSWVSLNAEWMKNRKRDNGNKKEPVDMMSKDWGNEPSMFGIL